MMHGNESRAALYHRFHFLLPFVYNPVVRRGWRVLVWAFWLVYFFFILAILALLLTPQLLRLTAARLVQNAP